MRFPWRQSTCLRIFRMKAWLVDMNHISISFASVINASQVWIDFYCMSFVAFSFDLDYSLLRIFPMYSYLIFENQLSNFTYS
jgi:hypothetical protein